MARYMVYDRCFRDESRQYGIHDLIEECNLALKRLYQSSGVSRRQVYYDMEFMKSPEGFHAPIISTKNDKGKKIFYYKDKSYSIFSFLSGEPQVSGSELAYLLNIICLLSGKDFAESLIMERGYNLNGLIESVKRWDKLKGLLHHYGYLKKMYSVLDGIIRRKKLHVVQNNKMLSLVPESIYQKHNLHYVQFYDPLTDEKNISFPLEDLVLLKST